MHKAQQISCSQWYIPSSKPFRIQHKQCTYKRKIEARSRNQCCRGKAISFTYSECVFFVALVIQHVRRMRRIILSCVACLAVP